MPAPNAATGTASSYQSVAGNQAAGVQGAVAVVSAVETVSNKAATPQQKEMSVGTALITVGVYCETVPGLGTVAGAIIIAAGAVLDLWASLFGNKFHSSTQVRWMLSYYQRFVLSQGNVTSDNKVDEKYTQDAYNWYSAVLGVYVYDNIRYHALRGEDWKTGKSLGNSVAQRAAAFLSFNDLENADRSLETVEKAVLISDMLDWKGATGSWKSLPVADFWYAQLTPAVLASSDIDSQEAALIPTDTTTGAALAGLGGFENTVAGYFGTTLQNAKYAIAGFSLLILFWLVSGKKK